MPAVPRVVLDTNVVLDLLHFRDPGVVIIDAAIRSGAVQAVTDAGCLEELRRVLIYAEFGLDEAARETLLARYRQCALTLDAPTAAAAWAPRCSDADDQKFIDLALHCGAAFLISKDKAVLRLARRMARISSCIVVAPVRLTLPG